MSISRHHSGRQCKENIPISALILCSQVSSYVKQGAQTVSIADTCKYVHAQVSGSSEHPALTFHLPGHKFVRAPSWKRVKPLTREGASTAASPTEPSYLPFLPCDRDPQLLPGRPHPSLSKHGTHPKPCSVVAAHYLGTLPRPPQRDTVCTIVVAFDTNPSSAVLCV